MTTTIPSFLRLRVIRLRPHLTLTEIQLVDDALLYQRIDGRDHIPTEIRAVRPSTADWARFRAVLDAAGFWSWPRRWPGVPDGYEGEFAIGVEWNGRAVVSVGALGIRPEVDAVLDEVQRLVGDARLRAPQAVSTLSSLDRHTAERINAVRDGTPVFLARERLGGAGRGSRPQRHALSGAGRPLMDVGAVDPAQKLPAVKQRSR